MPTEFAKEQIYALANAVIAEMQTPQFVERAKLAFSTSPIPANDEDVLLRYEAVQADFFTNRFDVASLAVGGAPVPSGKLDGEDVLRQLREACKKFKEPETERIITQLCVLEESQIDNFIATVPELAPIARQQQAEMQQQQHQGHQHSHGEGAAASSHGHSHGANSGMPQMTPQGTMMVEMAMQTLSTEQRNTLERVQTTMNNGSPPTPEDMREMFMIQQQIMAFMSTMQQFQGRGRGGAAAAGTRGGRGAGQ